MKHPIISTQLTQIFMRHYGYKDPTAAAEAAFKFMEVLDLYDIQLILGDWLVPERALPAAPKSAWDKAIDAFNDMEESGRVPWKTPELQN